MPPIVVFRSLGYMHTYDYNGITNISLSQCDLCLSLVRSEDEHRHTEWHDKLQTEIIVRSDRHRNR